MLKVFEFYLLQWLEYQNDQSLFNSYSKSSSEKVAVCTAIKSNLEVTMRVSVSIVRADLFLKRIFIMEQQVQFPW